MNPTEYYLPCEELGILWKKSHTITIPPTLAESGSLTNDKVNDSNKDLSYIIETLRDEPNVVDITVPNLT